MIRTATSCVVIAALLILSSVAVAQNQADIVEKAEESVLRIEVENVGQGSGFVVDASGIAVTNVHVMAGAQNGRATATFPNGTVCKILGSYIIDEKRDIAVIQLDKDSLPVLPLASQLPRKGEEVIALGSPMGLSFTATRGIVSAIRSEQEMNEGRGTDEFRGTWVQVDAALSPGNSGGPLINASGELVAMSTRASAGGRAQNLNFGISVSDVRDAIGEAKRKSLLDLSDGLGRVDMEEVNPKSGALVERSKVPERALKDYIEYGRDEFSVLAKSLRRELSSAKDKHKSLKTARIDHSLGADKIARDPQGRMYFGNEEVKSILVREQERRVRELEKLSQSIGTAPTSQSLYALLWNYGPPVNTQKKGSVGFMDGAIVVRAFTENDVVIQYRGAAYLLWVKDSSGLFQDQDVDPIPVYVVGAKTIPNPSGGSPIALTLLHAVLESELKEAVFGNQPEEQQLAGATRETMETVIQFRTWKSKNGTSIEAALISRDGSKVVLRRKDNGKEITVDVSQLSEFDRKFLEN